MAPDPHRIFLDANVLAAPVTRTLFLIGVGAINIVATWSTHAEQEANRHMRPRAMSVTDLRTSILEAELSPTGTNAARFTATRGADQQILADAVAADAAYLITNDVDDFAEIDLISAKVAAVNPDHFMAMRFSADAYQRALTQLVTSLKKPPRTIAEMHTLISRKHPRLHERFAALYETPPIGTAHGEPRELYRGARCIICARLARRPETLAHGCHPNCLTGLMNPDP